MKRLVVHESQELRPQPDALYVGCGGELLCQSPDSGLPFSICGNIKLTAQTEVFKAGNETGNTFSVTGNSVFTIVPLNGNYLIYGDLKDGNVSRNSKPGSNNGSDQPRENAAD